MSNFDFFGRTGELETLQDAYESPRAELLFTAADASEKQR